MTLKEALEGILSIPILMNTLISIDVWSLVHVTSGAILFALLYSFRQKNKYPVLFIMLLIWELIEFIFYGIIKIPSLFNPESLTNVIWDILLGMLGALIVDMGYRWK